MTLDEAMMKYPGATTFKFGDSAKMSAELLALVRAGQKTATCGALRDYQGAGSEGKPVIGRVDIALEWDGRPALAIRTVALDIHHFEAVPDDFRLAEGENDTAEGWARDHQAYFTRHGGFDPAMELLCERFEMVEDFR